MDNPLEGMTSKDIRRMSEEELLDMDYFLNLSLYPPFGGLFLFKSSMNAELSYKVKQKGAAH